MPNNFLITKADGEQEPFDPTKLETSLKHAGASSTERARIVARIMHDARDGMTTEEIYRRAFEILQQEEKLPVAARYSVKRAVLDLGPSGFPFEQFIAEILRAQGWSARTGVALTGRCAPHEVDVVAEKNLPAPAGGQAGVKRIGIEAKFHNEAGAKTDIKDALYVYARWEDLKKAPEASARIDEGWLVTNTRFTRNAVRYAQCSNLTLLGWDYPRSRNLLSMIEEARVHPLTCLTTLSQGEKRRLLDNKIVLCRHVATGRVLEEHGVKPSRVPQVLEEARQLCGI